LASVDFEVDSKIVIDYFMRGSSDIKEFDGIMDACIHSCKLIFFSNSRLFIDKRIRSLIRYYEYPHLKL